MRATLGGDPARQWGRQTDQRKERGMGGRRVPGVLNSPKQRQRHQAGDWWPKVGCAKAEGTRGWRRGTHHGSARFRVRRSGRRAGPGAPPPPSRRSVSPDLARGQLRPRWRLGSLRLPGRGAPPGRAETAAPPRPAFQCPPPTRRRTPCRDTRGTDSRSRAEPLRSAASPTPLADLPGAPATLFLRRPTLRWAAATLTRGGPPGRRCPSFPATAWLSAGSA